MMRFKVTVPITMRSTSYRWTITRPSRGLFVQIDV